MGEKFLYILTVLTELKHDRDDDNDDEIKQYSSKLEINDFIF